MKEKRVEKTVVGEKERWRNIMFFVHFHFREVKFLEDEMYKVGI